MDKELKEILLKHEERIANLEQIAKENEKYFKKIDEILEEHTETLVSHTKTLADHTKMLQDLHRSMLVIEDAVTNKIPALILVSTNGA